MKYINMNILYTFLVLVFVSVQGYAQKDTTELEMGKKKLIIIDKKTQKENAVYNLEKGKETFEKEIFLAEEMIRKHEEIIKEIEKQIEIAFEDFKADSNFNSDMHFEFNFEGIDPEKMDSIENEIKIKLKDYDIDEDVEIIILGEGDGRLDEMIEQKMEMLLQGKELDKLKAELEKHELLIELNEKKKYAFEDGIREIEKGILEIEAGLDDIDKDLKDLDVSHKGIKHFHKKRFNAHWAGFELGLFNFLNSSNKIAGDEDVDFMKIVPEKSMIYRLNIFEFNVPISKYSFGFATGAGLEWNSMALEENINLYEDVNGVIQAEYIDVNEKDYKKNRFNAAYITIPLLFEFQIPVKQRKIHFGAGLIGSMRAWSKQKQTYEIDGKKYKDKELDDFQLSPFRYGITARVGFGGLGIFADYIPVQLFKDGSGPEVYPIMIGLHIIDF